MAWAVDSAASECFSASLNWLPLLLRRAWVGVNGTPLAVRPDQVVVKEMKGPLPKKPGGPFAYVRRFTGLVEKSSEFIESL